MRKSRSLIELEEKNYSQVKKKTTNTELHYQQHITKHFLTYLKL